MLVYNQFSTNIGFSMNYVLHSIFIVVLLGLIIYDCVIFTNSVENFGKEYDLQDGAVGGILAAVGTALPETIVPIVAVLGAFFMGTSVSLGEDVALGAVLGSPFLLSTFALFVTGFSVLVCSWLNKRDCKMCSNPIILVRDLRFFAVSYTVAVFSAFVNIKSIKYCISVFLVLYYFWYVRRTLKKDFGEDCSKLEIEPLIFFEIFKKFFPYKKILICLQIAFSLVLLVFLAYFFVEEIKFFANVLNIHPMVMSLLLAPIATELPECFNSAIWITSSKDSLSISNITGALVFQSCIPAAIGISLTPWQFNTPAFLSVVLVYSSLLMVYVNSIKNNGVLNYRILLASGGFYLIYIIYVLKMLI